MTIGYTSSTSIASASSVDQTHLLGQQTKTGAQQHSSAANTVATDHVQLSPAAQARTLKSSGQSVNEIASSLGLQVATVDQYLGVNTSTQASLLATVK